MRTRRLAVAGLAAVLLTACGGGSGNGEADKLGPQVAKDAAAALDEAGSVHLSGTATSNEQQEKFDLDLEGSDARGSVSLGGQQAEIVRAGGKLYVKGSAEFWTAEGVPASAAGRWILLPQQSSGGLGGLTLKTLSDELRNPTNLSYKNAVTTATHDGAKVVVVTQSGGGTVDVAAEGTAYPLRFEMKGSDGGLFRLSRFGKKFGITAPAGAQDLSSVAGG